MPLIYRALNTGAVFADRLSALADLRRRYTIGGAPTVSASPFGNALNLDGVDDKVIIGQVSPLAILRSVSLSVYLVTNTEQIIDLDGGTHYIHANGGTITATGFVTPTIYVGGVAATAITAGVWTHIAVTTGTAFAPSNVQLATDNVNFGEIAMRNIVLWDRVLSVEEVLALAANRVFDY